MLHIGSRHAARLAIALTVAVVGACASASGGTGGAARDGAASSSASSASKDVLTAERLQSVAAENLHDAIARLEPEFLTGRRLGTPDVYIDDVRQHAGPTRLKQVPVASVAEVRYLSATAARKLPGAQSQGGALVVTLK